MDYQRSVHPSPRTKLGTLQLKLPGVSLESTLRERHYLAGPTHRRSHVERRWSVALHATLPAGTFVHHELPQVNPGPLALRQVPLG